MQLKKPIEKNFAFCEAVNKCIYAFTDVQLESWENFLNAILESKLVIAAKETPLSEKQLFYLCYLYELLTELK